MSGFLSVFGFGNSKLKQALQKGAVIIDVRTPMEFDSGHVPDSINIPVDRININMERLKNMNYPLILCSSPDSRSGDGVSILKAHGVQQVFDGGGWQRILKLVNSL